MEATTNLTDDKNILDFSMLISVSDLHKVCMNMENDMGVTHMEY